MVFGAHIYRQVWCGVDMLSVKIVEKTTNLLPYTILWRGFMGVRVDYCFFFRLQAVFDDVFFLCCSAPYHIQSTSEYLIAFRVFAPPFLFLSWFGLWYS